MSGQEYKRLFGKWQRKLQVKRKEQEMQTGLMRKAAMTQKRKIKQEKE